MKKLANYSEEDKVLLAVDCVIFGFDREELKILLIKRELEPERGKWSLMGGFLRNNENLDEAANRILLHLTGIKDIYLEQFHSYSKVDRDPAERTISVAYYSLINMEDHNHELTENFGAKWFTISSAPPLIFDHNLIVKNAISSLRDKTSKEPIGFELLPPKFTRKQLHNLYESIFNEELDIRNFVNKINSMDILIKLDEKDMSSSRKGSYLYKFDQEKYLEKKAQGFDFKI